MNVELKGSKLRDTWKQQHKEQLGHGYYGCDVDYVIVEKYPNRIVAYLDYKGLYDQISFTEAVVYNEWAKTKPVYIIESSNPLTGPFNVKQYLSADPNPDPPKVTWGEVIYNLNWQQYKEWELQLRKNYK